MQQPNPCNELIYVFLIGSGHRSSGSSDGVASGNNALLFPLVNQFLSPLAISISSLGGLLVMCDPNLNSEGSDQSYCFQDNIAACNHSATMGCGSTKGAQDYLDSTCNFALFPLDDEASLCLPDRICWQLNTRNPKYTEAAIL